MNHTLSGAALVAHWRNGGAQNSPAGPLFAAGEFAEADIVNATAEITWGCSSCSGSFTHPCC
jgi:hypothetical protein